MTTITREQQKQILIDTANHVINRDNTSPYSENLRELARIALSALEAEKGAEPRLHIKEQPAPVVPPAIEPDYEVIKGILPTTNPDEYACCIAADMWNACRADMFQGSQPVSNRDELSSPVILDGYALVPVEPTPEMREAFHVANEEYESGSYDVWKPDHQWQAMLAAAPQLKIALASIERCQAGFDAKHALFEVAIARFSKMNEGFPIKRFKADWVISWMLENFPPVAQKQGDN
ncbi:TPA: hypothetical protein ACJG22_004422 [Salmonella enterica subsp. enterica serovar Oranienburg]